MSLHLIFNDNIYYSDMSEIAQPTYVTVSNISNEANEEDIKEYLSLVGPVKSCALNKNGCKLSAKVCYHDH